MSIRSQTLACDGRIWRGEAILYGGAAFAQLSSHMLTCVPLSMRQRVPSRMMCRAFAILLENTWPLILYRAMNPFDATTANLA